MTNFVSIGTCSCWCGCQEPARGKMRRRVRRWFWSRWTLACANCVSHLYDAK